MIETDRLRIYAASQEQMEAFIAEQTDEILTAAYKEMLDGAVRHPNQWDWYAVWMIELKSGEHVGELCFRGLSPDGSAEIGYGILPAFWGNGYATDAVRAVVKWAAEQPDVKRLEAEAEAENTASLRVLEKTGFVPTGETGEEGPRFIWCAEIY